MDRVLIALALTLAACDDTWTASDLDGDGLTPEAGDCDDLNAEVYPGAAEVWYDGVDQDCDGNDGDADGDGFVPDEYADDRSWQDFPAHLAAGDCDDADAAVNPEGVEIWYDCVDQDCDGNDGDQDGDGFVLRSYAASCPSWPSLHGAGVASGDCVDAPGDDPGWVDEDGDPVDPSALGFTPAAINPGENDACYDGVDADCDGADDYDCDGDGHPRREECDDADPTVLPDPEIYDAPYDCIDADCDGSDGDKDRDGYVPNSYTASCPTWRSFGGHLSAGDCWDDPDFADPDFVPALNDLDDLDASEVYPGAPDRPYDAIDADCAGDSDFDVDGDGFDADGMRDRTGNFAGPDCDDGDAGVNPDAAERTNDGIDGDCDGEETCPADADGDGFGSATAVEGSRHLDCVGPDVAPNTDDCDDGDEAAWPGAPELPGDEVDQSCDGAELCFFDADGDGFGGASTVASADLDCADAGEAVADDDCDDGDASFNPDARDACAWGLADSQGLDEDCDGLVDEGSLAEGSCAVEGDLVLSELSAYAATADPLDGQWFELLNASGYLVYLDGLTVEETLSGASFVVADHLALGAGERAVFCHGDNALSQAAGCDYVYGGDVAWPAHPLGEGSAPDLDLTSASGFGLRLSLRGGDQGDSVLDALVVDPNAGTWPGRSAGFAFELSESALAEPDAASLNDEGARWCLATGRFYDDGAGVEGWGSPGGANSCP